MSTAAIREHILKVVTLILDNTQPLYSLLTEAAHRAVMEGMGTGATLDEYREAYAGRGGAYDRREYERTVGVYVRDALSEYVEESMPAGAAGTLILVDLLDFGDSQQWELFGAHYLPDPDDIDPDDFA